MQALILYIPKSDHGSEVEGYVNEFNSRYPGLKIDLLDAESRDGVAKCKLYDILNYPSVIVFTEDMVLQNAWIGKLPQFSEVYAYMM
jgi:hypothetical protein